MDSFCNNKEKSQILYQMSFIMAKKLSFINMRDRYRLKEVIDRRER